MTTPIVPVWLEDWRFCALRNDPMERPAAMLTVDEVTVMQVSVGRTTRDAGERLGMRAMLATAAPVLVRDALAHEWVNETRRAPGWCPSCSQVRPAHARDCTRDEGLRQAGFDDQETRDSARLMLQRVRRI